MEYWKHFMPTGFRMRALTSFCLIAAAVLAVLLITRFASAHPLGNFSVNRYSRLELSQVKLRVYYVVDMAEIPALQERGIIDTDRDGTISGEEHDRYLGAKAEELSQGLGLHINGKIELLKLISKELTFPPGQGGLLTQRLAMTLETSLPLFSKGRPWQVDYDDHNYADRLGWKEIIARPLENTALLESNVPKQDQSDELRNYPKELLYKPLEMKKARLLVAPCAGAVIREDQKAKQTKATTHAEDRFSRLITARKLTFPVVLMALLAAMGLGAVHSLSPGHGKTIVAAYLVGSRGTPRHALFLGATVTLTHTIGVFVLGLVTLVASRHILPEQLYPWLGTLSGLIVVGIGATLFARRLRILLKGNGHFHHHPHGHDPDSHGHTHEQGDHNNHVHDHHYSDEHVRHSHSHDHNNHHHNGHGIEEVAEHGHHHSHSHDLHSHEHDFAVGHNHDDDPDHHGHSHLPPGIDGSPVTWRSLLALGISGGILPCPSALVVLLGAISLHRVGFGLVLIIAFSIGLAGVLTGIGLLFLKGRQILSRFRMTSPLLRFLPVGSAFVIAFLGMALTINALSQFVN